MCFARVLKQLPMSIRSRHVLRNLQAEASFFVCSVWCSRLLGIYCLFGFSFSFVAFKVMCWFFLWGVFGAFLFWRLYSWSSVFQVFSECRSRVFCGVTVFGLCVRMFQRMFLKAFRVQSGQTSGRAHHSKAALIQEIYSHGSGKCWISRGKKKSGDSDLRGEGKQLATAL